MNLLKHRLFPWLILALLVSGLIFCNRHTAPQMALNGHAFRAIEKLWAQGFKPATVFNSAGKWVPEHVDPKIITETIYVSGTWTPDSVCYPGDSLPVTVEGVGLIDGSRWLRLNVSGKPVNIDVSEWYGPAPGRLERRWQGYLELTQIHGTFCVGFGAGYRVLTVAGVGVVPSLSTTTAMDWAAAELRLTRNVWSGVSIGGGCGYRIGIDPGLHISGSISVEL